MLGRRAYFQLFVEKACQQTGHDLSEGKTDQGKKPKPSCYRIAKIVARIYASKEAYHGTYKRSSENRGHKSGNVRQIWSSYSLTRYRDQWRCNI